MFLFSPTRKHIWEILLRVFFFLFFSITHFFFIRFSDRFFFLIFLTDFFFFNSGTSFFQICFLIFFVGSIFWRSHSFFICDCRFLDQFCCCCDHERPANAYIWEGLPVTLFNLYKASQPPGPGKLSRGMYMYTMSDVCELSKFAT